MSARQNRYKLVPAFGVDPETGKEYELDAASPAKGLTALCAKAGLKLASQDGRYGRLEDGTSVMAATMPWSRRRVDPMERQTRV